MFLLQDPLRKPPPALVRLRRRVDSPAVFAKFRLGLLKQPARRNCPQQLGIVRGTGAPEFGNVPSDVRSHGNGPLKARGGAPRGSGSIPKRGNVNIFRVPIPSRLILL